MTAATPPGWYHLDTDPDVTLRWYDGSAWTGHIRSHQPAQGANGLATATQTVARTAFMQRVAPTSATAPPELWLIALAMFAVGAFLLWPLLRYGYLGFDAIFAGGDFGRALGALILMFLTIAAAMGGALVLLAFGLLRASRVAQILTFVVCGIAALTVIALANDGILGGGSVAVTFLILAAICGGLTMRPAVREYFARDNRPIGVALAATANAYFGWVLLLDGLLFLLAAAVSASFAIGGLLLLAAAGVLVTTARPLRRGERSARTRSLVAYAVVAVGLLITSTSNGSALTLIIPLTVLICGTIGLTVPESSKAHFGDRPVTATPPLAEPDHN